MSGSDDEINIMKTNFTYPNVDDEDLQLKLYKKREFYYNKYPERPELKKYKDIKDYRDNVCARDFSLHEYQTLAANIINPDTPFPGAIIFHGLGTGKTCAGVAIAEKFKPLAQKYNTKIYILVPGPLLKESWKYHLIKCTGETYMKKIDKSTLVDEVEIDRLKKAAIAQAMQFYKFLSYKSFYKRVLGEKIIEKKEGTKVIYRKTEEGEFERDVSVDRIYNLNNTLIIVDEAHNLTGNAYGEALKTVIQNSHNLKVLLMSATPMKNLADDIVELVNYLRPVNSPMLRDKIFSTERNYEMQIKPGGLEYFKKMASGYISHVRGSDPMVFAKRVDRGVKPVGLKFTNVIRCGMSEFQQKGYDILQTEENEDALDRKSEAVANFIFPALSPDKKSIIGTSGNEGIELLKSQIKLYSDQLNQRIAKDIIKNEKETGLIELTHDNSTITGKILKEKYLKIFSTKFFKALHKLNKLVWGKKGPKTAFIYSNLVKVGIDIFEQILLQNGYLLFEEDKNLYQITPDTRCYYCGKIFSEHGEIKKESGKEKINQSSDSSDYKEYEKHKATKELQVHTFYPATFITVTGKASDEAAADVIPEEKKRIIDNVFNTFENREGKYLKFILGSKVMNEGISLYNVGETHILDVYFNFGRVDQVVGRAIRWCSHYKQMSENNVFPFVNVYKYVVKIKDGLSSEEDLYRKAELKYLLIKKIERAMKEVSFDCALNYQANIFKEEINDNKNCKDPLTVKNDENMCPMICDYTSCDFKCDNMKLNVEYYDPSRKIYKALAKSELDLNTFSTQFARTEIEFCKKKIKELYLLNYLYLLSDITSYVKGSYPPEKTDLFDEFFVYKALDELIPLNQNELNSFKDTVTDKNNRSGYLIFVDKYYIFQPFDQNEDVPIYYRTKYVKPITQPISLFSYIKSMDKYKEYMEKNINFDEDEENKEEGEYDYNKTVDYYDQRNENKYVGIIDKDKSRKKSKEDTGTGDVFKLREKRAKILEKKRGTGIPSAKGAVCVTKEKPQIDKIAKDLGIKFDSKTTRHELCDMIRNEMEKLEKYQKGEKKTYLMVPSNHPVLPFPLNIEDRIEYIKEQLKKRIPIKLIYDKKANKIEITADENLDDYESIFTELKIQKDGKKYIISLE